jgi:Transglutaminase-like superfamily
VRRYVVEAWLLLLYFEYVMHFRRFRELHRMVRDEPVTQVKPETKVPTETLCHAMDLACVFYFKQVLCLQRSAATTVLLRRHGWSVEMVIGAQLLPYRSHAWCELNGAVVNDKPYTAEIYTVLERC